MVLWGMVHVAPPSQVQMGFALMVASWSLVEVPRYAFYIVKLLGGDEAMPYWLKWLRYSLFIVLYPTGITGMSPQTHMRSAPEHACWLGNARLSCSRDCTINR